MHIRPSILVFLSVIFFLQNAFSQSVQNVWIGGDTRWNRDGAWTNGIPDASSDVVFSNSTWRYAYIYGPGTEWANGSDTYTISSLAIGTTDFDRAYIGLDSSVSSFIILNDLVSNAKAGSFSAITSYNAKGWFSEEPFDSADLIIGGSVYVNSATLFLGSSNTNIAPFNVLKDITIGGNVSVADGAMMTVVSQSFTVGATTNIGAGARLAGYTHMALNGAVTLDSGTILIAKKSTAEYPPFDTDHGSLYFGEGVDGKGTITNQIAGSATTFKNVLSSSYFAGNLTANLIYIEGGKTQSIDGLIGFSSGANIVIRDGSRFLTSSTVKINTLSNEGADAFFGNNAGGRNYQDIYVGELHIAEGTTFTFEFDLGSSDTSSDKLVADNLYFQVENTMLFHFAGGMVGEYEVGEFGGMDGYDFASDPNDLFSWTSDLPLEGYFEWDGQILNFIVTEVPEPSTCAAIFGALALALAAYRRRK